jgi:hypothetical protein
MPSVCLCVPPLIVARQRLGRHVPVATNTRNNSRIPGGAVFYTVRVVWKESLWVCLCMPPSLLGNGTVNTLLRQRRIVRGVVSCAVCVVSKVSLWAFLRIFLSLLGNGPVNTFLLQRTIFGGVVFYAVRVVSNENWRLVLARASCC